MTFTRFGSVDDASCDDYDSSGDIDIDLQGQICIVNTLSYADEQQQVSDLQPYSPSNTRLSRYDDLLYITDPPWLLTFTRMGSRDLAECWVYDSSGNVDSNLQEQICMRTTFSLSEALEGVEELVPYVVGDIELTQYEDLLYIDKPILTFTPIGIIDRAACWEFTSSGEIDEITQQQICFGVEGTILCGNNIREDPPECATPGACIGSEVCDGTDDSACPGRCIPPGAPMECTCPAPIHCNEVSDWRYMAGFGRDCPYDTMKYEGDPFTLCVADTDNNGKYESYCDQATQLVEPIRVGDVNKEAAP
jgi:hypothetical protein